MEENIKAILNKLSLEELNELRSLLDTDLDKVRSSMLELADEKYQQQEETKKKYEKYFKQREVYQEYISESLKCKHPTEMLIASIMNTYPNEFRLGWFVSPYYKAWYYKHNNSCIIPCDRNKIRKYLWNERDKFIDDKDCNDKRLFYDIILSKLAQLPKLDNKEYPDGVDPIDGFNFAIDVYYDSPYDIRHEHERSYWISIVTTIFKYMIYDPSEEIKAPDYPMAPREMYIKNPEFIKDFKYD